MSGLPLAAFIALVGLGYAPCEPVATFGNLPVSKGDTQSHSSPSKEFATRTPHELQPWDQPRTLHQVMEKAPSALGKVMQFDESATSKPGYKLERAFLSASCTPSDCRQDCNWKSKNGICAFGVWCICWK